ncbi:MAG TPA: hypothetical protein VJ722_04340, partial [Rhodanobacteraceae bacterium]|nr:hypothetical protein [Rhodanobacteraceae bacterium]
MHSRTIAALPRALSLSIVLALLYPAGASAQDSGSQQQPAGDSAAQAESAPVTLGTIIVTANRRDETLQDVAMPVSVVTY